MMRPNPLILGRKVFREGEREKKTKKEKTKQGFKAVLYIRFRAIGEIRVRTKL